MPKRSVLLVGGSGLVGRRLAEVLTEAGWEVRLLTRGKPSGNGNDFAWNPETGSVDEAAFQNLDALVNLAGANLSEKRWTKARKQELMDSRVETTRLLHRTVQRLGSHLSCFVSASAIGYYGRGISDKPRVESEAPGEDFLAGLCQAWEGAADVFEKDGIRTVKIRTGVVLSVKGGALPPLLQMTKLGVGAALGTGKQFMPWIHVDDLCGIYRQALEDEQMLGVYNAVAPQPATNHYFMKTLSLVLKKQLFPFHVPGFLLKTVFGEMAQVLLEGHPVSAGKIRTAGYVFQYNDLESALRALPDKHLPPRDLPNYSF